MGAAIVKGTNDAGVVAHDDKRTQAELSRNEVVVVRNLAFVREVDPGTPENMGHFRIEDRRVGVEEPVNPILLNELVPVIERSIGDMRAIANSL